MKKIIGLIAFLAIIYVLLLAADPGARLAANHFNLGRRIGLYGIISLGAGMLIITGGIDLSIGSVVGLCATLLAMLLRGDRFPRFPFKGWFFEQLNAGLDWLGGLVNFPEHPWAAIIFVLLVGMAIGLVNGLLVTKVRVQAFVVTLCGLFIYRGISRFMAEDQVKGLGNQFGDLKTIFYSSEAVLGLPMSLVYFLVLLALATVFMHLSIHGRYFFAIGANEKAARYSGVPTDRYKILAYVICSTLAAFYGVLYLMQENSAQPSSTGNFLELYAIAGAVLGGCSLRGGEGSVGGLVIGTSILVLLPNLSLMLGIPSALEYTVIGGALLLGATLDEVLRRVGQKDR
ncbi:MAG: ABC transporter permease [Gemmataceae bacterium]|nr:ABC transporter permease [Gemmataceae bacterium]